MDNPYSGGYRAVSRCRARAFFTKRYLSLVAALLLGGCDLINPAEDVPTYLQLAPFSYTPGVMGAPVTADLPAAKVYANGLLIGIFDLPAKVPVLAAGNVPVRIVPAIIIDGQRATRYEYPFYTDVKQTLELVPGATTRLALPVSFNERAIQTDFDVSDDFDNAADLRDFGSPRSTLPAGTNYVLEAGVTEGGRSGVGRVKGLPNRTENFLLESIWKGALPQRGAAVYLELDYYSTMEFRVGVSAGLTSQPTSIRSYRADLTVLPKREWTKLYVNLTEEVSGVNNPTGADFQVFIQGFPTGAATDVLALDNVRLVRPK